MIEFSLPVGAWSFCPAPPRGSKSSQRNSPLYCAAPTRGTAARRRRGHRRDIKDADDGHRGHESLQPRLPFRQRVIHRADHERAQKKSAQRNRRERGRRELILQKFPAAKNQKQQPRGGERGDGANNLLSARISFLPRRSLGGRGEGRGEVRFFCPRALKFPCVSNNHVAAPRRSARAQF